MTPPAAGRGPARRTRPTFGATRSRTSTPDLAARLVASQRSLATRLGRRESLAELLAVTHRSLHPQVVAQLLVDLRRDKGLAGPVGPLSVVSDDLTRLYNSRHLSLSLQREAKRAMRTSRALSLDELIRPPTAPCSR